MLALKTGLVDRDQTRTTLIEVAAHLLHEQGRAAVTTRAVAKAAGVQAPTIYRLFGDKDGLLDAVAEHVSALFVAEKSHAPTTADPVEDLRAGWEMHISFGLNNPDLFGLLIDPSRDSRSPAAVAGMDALRSRVHRVAAAGRLRVSERRAVDVVYAAGIGTVLTLLSVPLEDRDPDLSEALRDTVFSRILTQAPAPADSGLLPAVVTFRTRANDLEFLTGAERALLIEWLDRMT